MKLPQQFREILTRVPASPATDELQDVVESLWKEHVNTKLTLAQRESAIQKAREVLRSPANNMRFMQIAGPARQCLNILKLE